MNRRHRSTEHEVDLQFGGLDRRRLIIHASDQEFPGFACDLDRWLSDHREFWRDKVGPFRLVKRHQRYVIGTPDAKRFERAKDACGEHTVADDDRRRRIADARGLRLADCDDGQVIAVAFKDGGVDHSNADPTAEPGLANE